MFVNSESVRLTTEQESPTSPHTYTKKLRNEKKLWSGTFLDWIGIQGAFFFNMCRLLLEEPRTRMTGWPRFNLHSIIDHLFELDNYLLPLSARLSFFRLSTAWAHVTWVKSVPTSGLMSDTDGKARPDICEFLSILSIVRLLILPEKNQNLNK